MATRSVTIEIKASDRFSDVLKKYEQQMGHAAMETRQVGQASQQAQGMMGGLKGAAVALGGAFAAMQIGQTAVEMVNLGRHSLQVRGVFEALSGGVGEAAVNLEQMRQATHNSVSDLDLMSASNKLLQIGIAQTGDQAAELTRIAVGLGRSMGQDAAEAVDNFALTLANSSLPRLDALGISAGRVRQRIQELIDTGRAANREEAFKMAVLEEGGRALERVEETSAATGTSLERVETAWSNFWTNTSETLATWAVGIADGFEQVVQSAQDFQTSLDELQAAQNLQTKRRAERGGRAIQGAETRFSSAALAAAEGLGLTPDAARQTVSLYMEAIQSAFANGAEIGQITDILRQQYGDTDPIINALITSLEEVPDALQDLGKASYAAFGEMGRHINVVDRDTNNLIDSYRELYNESRRVQAAEESRARIVSSMASVQSNGLAGLISLRRQAGSASALAAGATYSTPEQANTLNAMLADAEQRLAEMESMDAVPQDVVDRARALVDNMREMADEANRGADAMDRLSSAFGQTGGGLQGEVNQAVIDQMRAAGATPEQIAAFQRTGALATGQETRGSLAFQEQIAPMIAQAATELGPEVASALTEAVANYIQSAGGAATGEGMVNALTGAGLIVGQGGGQQFTVRPGDTISGLAASLGLTPEQVMAATGTTNPRLLQPGTYGMGGGLGFDFQGGAIGAAGGYAMPEGTSTFATDIGGIAEDYSTISTDASTTAGYVEAAMQHAQAWREAQAIVSGDITQARKDLEDLTGDVQQVTVAVEFTGDIETLKALMNGDLELSASVDVNGGGGGSKGIKTAVRENYGSVPGVDPRVVGPHGL